MKELKEFYYEGDFNKCYILPRYHDSIHHIDYVIPGSFNPLHEGHLNIYQYLKDKNNIIPYEVSFELSIQNCDKEPLDFQEVVKRTRQFWEFNLPVVLTKAATFSAKSRLFANKTVFCVGADTAIRIFYTKHYLNSDKLLQHCIKNWREKENRFLVFPRNGFDFQVKPEYVDLIELVEDFESSDISSTELRSRNN